MVSPTTRPTTRPTRRNPIYTPSMRSVLYDAVFRGKCKLLTSIRAFKCFEKQGLELHICCLQTLWWSGQWLWFEGAAFSRMSCTAQQLVEQRAGCHFYLHVSFLLSKIPGLESEMWRQIGIVSLLSMASVAAATSDLSLERYDHSQSPHKERPPHTSPRHTHINTNTHNNNLTNTCIHTEARADRGFWYLRSLGPPPPPPSPSPALVKKRRLFKSIISIFCSFPLIHVVFRWWHEVMDGSRQAADRL